jgi:translocation and assembly module TamB
MERAAGELALSLSPGVEGHRLVLEARKLTMEGSWFPIPFEGVDATIHASAEGWEFRQITGRLGGGDWRLGGRIQAEGWWPRAYDLRATLTDARVQYLDFLPPLEGDADMSFTGPLGELLLAGRIDVEDMVFLDRIDWEQWVLEVNDGQLDAAADERGTNYFAMDIEVVADNTLRVRNNLADLVAGGRLRIVGDTEQPGVVGDIRALPGGRAYLKEREFEVLRGEIRFEDPFAFDPALDFLLSTQLRTRDDTVKVDVRIAGPWSGWYTETNSDPAMSQADINALLVFGMTREDLERYGALGGALAVEGGDLVASSFGLVERVGEGLFQAEIIRPDRIDLVSGLDQRGVGTLSSELRLLAEKDVSMDTTVVFETNLVRQNDWYVGLERRLAERLYLRGYRATEQQGRQLGSVGAYGAEFNIRWELD